jgi:hypothetical protein
MTVERSPIIKLRLFTGSLRAFDALHPGGSVSYDSTLVSVGSLPSSGTLLPGGSLSYGSLIEFGTLQ